MYVAVNAVGFAALTLLAVWLLAGVNRRRPWDAALVAASPVLALTAVINWDLLALVFVAGALWAWARDRPVLTGVMIGLGTAAKLYPLFLLGALLVICVRDRRLRDFAAAVLAAVVVVDGDQPPRLRLRARASGPTSGPSTPTAARTSGRCGWSSTRRPTSASPPTRSTSGRGSSSASWCVGVLVLGLRAPVTPRFAQLGLLILIGFLLVNKVYSPQYVLWLLPLAALARPRVRDHLVWQGGEIFYFAMVWFYLGGFLDPAGGGDVGFYWVAIAVRVAAELYLAAMVVRDVLRPERDPVRNADYVTTTSSNAVAV